MRRYRRRTGRAASPRHTSNYEPRLDELLTSNLAMGRIRFTTELAEAVATAQTRIPCRRHANAPRRRLRRFVLRVRCGRGHSAASQRIHSRHHEIEVPVGTSREIERRLKLLRPDADFAVCSNPEFLREAPRSTTLPIPTACWSAATTIGRAP